MVFDSERGRRGTPFLSPGEGRNHKPTRNLKGLMFIDCTKKRKIKGPKEDHSALARKRSDRTRWDGTWILKKNKKGMKGRRGSNELSAVKNNFERPKRKEEPGRTKGGRSRASKHGVVGGGGGEQKSPKDSGSIDT